MRKISFIKNKITSAVIINYTSFLCEAFILHKVNRYDIHGVCTKPTGQRVYVQASYIIADKATRQREFGNLQAIKDNYPKYVISMTPLLTQNDDNGITHLHLRTFLRDGLPG